MDTLKFPNGAKIELAGENREIFTGPDEQAYASFDSHRRHHGCRRNLCDEGKRLRSIWSKIYCCWERPQ